MKAVLRILPTFVVATACCIAQSQLTDVTRQPDAYNTWKLALSAGEATPAASLSVPEGFTVDLLRSARPEEDSWVSMAFDRQGRLTIGREKRGLLRITLSAGPGGETVEVIDDTLLECRGLLYAYDALYVVANNSKVLVRLRERPRTASADSNAPGSASVFTVEELLRTDGGVGHGRNHVKLGPDGMIYLVHGNNVIAPETEPGSPLRNFQDDRLIPCPWDPQMFDGDVRLPAGHILCGDRDGKRWTLFAGGLRNALDIAFNEDGEMFTFDADMEWDTGTPWYRPCRVNHVISGADYGWRRGTSKWPEYFPDCGPTAVNIGLASPTGIGFGTESRFPDEWRRALFIGDWSYGRIIAVHLTPNGASYTGRAENFVIGKPLNVTDLAFGPDGAMYFITGGRRTQSGLYRVRYTGAARQERSPRSSHIQAAEARKLRRSLEVLHGRTKSGAVDSIWPHLGSSDPAIRHAARIALEWQDVSKWKSRALSEKDPLAKLTALLALARSGTPELQRAVIDQLNALDFAALSTEEQILAGRVYQLALLRLGPIEPSLCNAVVARLDPNYPAKDWRVTHLLCEILVHLGAPKFREKTVGLLAQATRSEDLLQYLFYLRLVQDGWTLDERRIYFTALNHAETLEGARDYQRSMKMIRSEVLEQLSPAERDAIASLLVAATSITPPASTGPQVPGREWKMEELEPLLDRVGRGRSFEAGKQAFAGAQCVFCHRMGREGGLVGPDLTAASSRFNRRDMLDSILHPSRVIDDKFRNVAFTLESGGTIVGTIEREDDRTIGVRLSPLSPDITTVEKSSLRRREPSAVSPMPSTLLNILTQNQVLDLLAYLESGGNPDHPNFRK